MSSMIVKVVVFGAAKDSAFGGKVKTKQKLVIKVENLRNKTRRRDSHQQDLAVNNDSISLLSTLRSTILLLDIDFCYDGNTTCYIAIQ